MISKAIAKRVDDSFSWIRSPYDVDRRLREAFPLDQTIELAPEVRHDNGDHDHAWTTTKRQLIKKRVEAARQTKPLPETSPITIEDLRAEATQALEAYKAVELPLDVRTTLRLLEHLFYRTGGSRVDDQIEAKFKSYLAELRRWPADVVAYTLFEASRGHKFFPSLAELIERLDYRARDRFRTRALLERFVHPDADTTRYPHTGDLCDRMLATYKERRAL